MGFKLPLAECDGQHSANNQGRLYLSEQPFLTGSGSICVDPSSLTACDKIKLAHSSNSESKIYHQGKKQNVRKKEIKGKTNLREVTMNSKNEG